MNYEIVFLFTILLVVCLLLLWWKRRLNVNYGREWVESTRKAEIESGGWVELQKNNKEVAELPNTAFIDSDLMRTFPDEKMFDKIRGTPLRNVLISVSDICSCGYVQGMNEIAAVILTQVQESKATTVMTTILKCPKYSVELALTRRELIADHFEKVLNLHLPDVSNHLTNFGVVPSIYISWFVTLFLHVAPPSEALVIFNDFINFGWSAIYRVALTILSNLRREILKKKNSSQLMILILHFKYESGESSQRNKWKDGTAMEAKNYKINHSECNWME